VREAEDSFKICKNTNNTPHTLFEQAETPPKCGIPDVKHRKETIEELTLQKYLKTKKERRLCDHADVYMRGNRGFICGVRYKNIKIYDTVFYLASSASASGLTSSGFSPSASCKSEVQRVKLSLNNCMINVLSL